MDGQGPAKRRALSHKRFRLACENCRHKKAKCDSVRPSCGFCSRLRQTCQYASPDPSQTAPATPDMNTLLSRIARLESALPSSVPNGPPLVFPVMNAGQTPATPAQFSQAISQPITSGPMSNLNTGDFPFYDANLSELNNMCGDNVMLSASNINPHCLRQLLDAYFLHHHNQPYSFFHEAHFRQDMSLGLVPDYLITAICAVAIRFATDNGPQTRAASAFSRSSWTSVSQLDMDTEGEFDLEVVQSLTLLAIFEYTDARQRGAWIKIGLATRLAQALDLHLEPPQSLPSWNQEIRRRTFWSVYLFDKLITCDRKRPVALLDNICKVSLPCSEASMKAVIPPERTGSLDMYTQGHAAGLSEPSPLARLMIVASVLSRCSRYVIQSSDVDVPPWDVRSQYQQVHSALLYLETELHFERPVREAVERSRTGPTNSHEGAPIVISYALYHLCHCLLSHASLLRQRMVSHTVGPPLTFMRHAAEDNQAHAVELSKLLGFSSITGIAARCSFMSYCAIVSAVIHAISRNSETTQIQQQSEESLEISSQFLANNSAYWHNSGVMVSNSSPQEIHTVEMAKECSRTVSDLISQYNALVYFKSISSEFHYDTRTTTGESVRSTQMHEEIMAYLTDYGSLSSEKGNGINTALFGSSFNDLARLAVSKFPAQTRERAESGNITELDPDPADGVFRNSPGHLLHLGLQFDWPPDSFGV